jgi:FkbM family methyltransferase
MKRRLLGLRFGNSNILRLPFGGYWLLEASALDHDLAADQFERAECAFVSRLLQPGMTVIDAGAHHGLYTLLASRKLGRSGRVLAFEPSARERVRLEKNLRINACRNVTVRAVALGAAEGTADLFVVDGNQDCFNSLRPPAIDAQTRSVPVQVTSLDESVREAGIVRANFLKLDIEGGELEALRGAQKLLSEQRPVAMIEVQDVRTKPWGYAAREIIDFMRERGYDWYRVTEEGSLTPLDTSAANYDGNFVAAPRERDMAV